MADGRFNLETAQTPGPGAARARERADEQLVAEKRARELEARASVDRAARERAETDRLAAETRAEAAESKVQLAQKAVTPAVVSDSKRPSGDQSFAFDALSPELRRAAQAARANAKRAEDKSYWARMAAEAAETAAKRARAKEPGTIAFDFDGGSYLARVARRTRAEVAVQAARVVASPLPSWKKREPWVGVSSPSNQAGMLSAVRHASLGWPTSGFWQSRPASSRRMRSRTR